jgi:hypothetical protein
VPSIRAPPLATAPGHEGEQLDWPARRDITRSIWLERIGGHHCGGVGPWRERSGAAKVADGFSIERIDQSATVFQDGVVVPGAAAPL